MPREGGASSTPWPLNFKLMSLEHWIARSSRAKTRRRALASPRRNHVRAVEGHPRKEGAGNAGCSGAPAASHANERSVRAKSPQVRRTFRHSLRDGLSGFLRALPGDRAFLPPSLTRCACIVTNLISASRDQDHTTWPSASSRVVAAHDASIASRAGKS
jgi:hypothetical protein